MHIQGSTSGAATISVSDVSIKMQKILMPCRIIKSQNVLKEENILIEKPSQPPLVFSGDIVGESAYAEKCRKHRDMLLCEKIEKQNNKRMSALTVLSGRDCEIAKKSLQEIH